MNISIEFYKKNEDIIENMSGKTSVKTSGKMSVKILEYIPELSEKIGITERSIERNIQKLQKEQKLKRLGGDKGRKWIIID